MKALLLEPLQEAGKDIVASCREVSFWSVANHHSSAKLSYWYMAGEEEEVTYKKSTAYSYTMRRKICAGIFPDSEVSSCAPDTPTYFLQQTLRESEMCPGMLFMAACSHLLHLKYPSIFSFSPWLRKPWPFDRMLSVAP